MGRAVPTTAGLPPAPLAQLPRASLPGVGSVVMTVVVMMVEVVVSWLSSSVEPFPSLSALSVRLTAAPVGAAVGAVLAPPGLSGRG